jgi:hypothetical protein
MRSCLVVTLAISALLPAAGQTAIGVVLKSDGSWCRNGRDKIQTGSVVYASDQISYCESPFKKSHFITIHFSTPPHDRTYRCETPGVCSRDSKLWLKNPIAPKGGPVLSSPRVSYVPDAVIQGNSPDWATLTASQPTPMIICQVQAGNLVKCSKGGEQHAKAGLYAVLSPEEKAAGVIAVMEEGAAAPPAWKLQEGSAKSWTTSDKHSDLLAEYDLSGAKLMKQTKRGVKASARDSDKPQ